MLDFLHRLLARKCQLNMSAGLNRAQANTSSMSEVKMNARIRITDNWATRPAKGTVSRT